MANNTSSDYIKFIKKNITKYMSLIMEKRFLKEPFNDLLEVYINARYYNYYESKNKNFVANINSHMREKAIEIIKEKEEKDITKIEQMFYLFKYILYLDDVLNDKSLKDVVYEIDEYKRLNLNIIDDDFITEFSSLVGENQKKKEKYLNGFNSDKFYLRLNETNKKNAYFVELEHNVKFNKIYSDYSINKVYNTGIVYEDRMIITYHLVSNLILKDKVKGNFKNKYLVSFPISIFNKKEKNNRIFHIIDDEIIKNNLVITFIYSDYLDNKETIDDLVKEGYLIGIILDDKFENTEKNLIWLSIFEYIIPNDQVILDSKFESKIIKKK
ncbi:MAG: hypothetical protein IJO57_02960 [Bacilli bacterium]|nr:hypothetical protein [Bacilli bacterium]